MEWPIDKSGTAPFQTRDFYEFVHNPEPVRNQIELLAFLKTGGTLEISVGGKTTRKEVGPGMQAILMDLAEGTPEFRLIRNNQVVINGISAASVSRSFRFHDALYHAGQSPSNPCVGNEVQP